MNVNGIPILGWFCLVPLMLSLADLPLGWGIFYGTLAGVLQTMISNYWLGTFNLLTLQFVSVVTLVQYIPFMAIAVPLLKRSRGLGFLVFPAHGRYSIGCAPLDSWATRGECSAPPSTPLSRSFRSPRLPAVWGVTFIVTLANP